MKKLMFLIFVLFTVPLMAQVNVQLAWDASATPSTPENPIQYYLYACLDSALKNCAQYDAAQNLTYGPIALQHATTTWFYATARNHAIAIINEAGETTMFVQESDKSNILQVKAFAPPGNPKNNRIQVTQVGEAKSDIELYAEIH